MSRQDLSYSAGEPFNPYGAPQAPIGGLPPTLGGEGPPIAFTFDSVLSRSWALFQSRMGLCVGVYILSAFVSFALQFGIGLVGGAVQNAAGDPNVASVVSLVISLLALLMGIWLTLGQTLAYLRVARTLPASFRDLFAGGPYLGTMVLASILIGLLMGGISFLGAAPGLVMMAAMGAKEPTALVILGVGLFCAVLFMLVYWVYLSQIVFVILDKPGIGAMGALKESIRLTKGKFWRISFVYLVGALINLLGLLALFIGLLFTVPFTVLVIAVMYTALAAERPLGPEEFAPGMVG